MTPKLRFGALSLVLLVAAACGGSQPPASKPVSISFVPQTVDFLDDVGYSPSLAVDAQGVPYLSYLGFTHVLTKQEKKNGVVPPARPVSAPRLPALLVANQANGIWNRGAAVQSSDQATGPKVPIDRSDQTATAVDQNGVQHVVWTEKDGLFYANNQSGSFPDKATKIAGSTASGPSIAVDASGTPWIAFYKGRALEAAKVSGSKATVERVASATSCSSCPAPKTSIQAGPKGPMIAYQDGGAAMLATRSGKGWSTSGLAKSGGIGISLAVDKAGTAHASFFDGRGDVVVAQSSLGTVQVTRVGKVAVTDPAKDLSGGTAIAVAKDGTEYVAWGDPSKGVLLGRSSGGQFSMVQTQGTEPGTEPALAATPSGGVVLAWFDPATQDLKLGAYPQSKVGFLAVPSPSPTVGQPSPPSGQACAPSDVLITAPPGAATTGFQSTKASAPGKKAFVICFDNKDSTQHNVAIYKSESEATAGGKALFTGDIVQGPTRTEYKVNALQPGSYFFRCDVHPTVMTGTLTVK